MLKYRECRGETGLSGRTAPDWPRYRSPSSFVARYVVCLSLTLCLSAVAGAQDNTLELESTIKGNQEQPKVLYIVPWRKIEGPDSVYQPLESLIAENFSLIDREEFRRQVKYRREAAQSLEAEADAAPGS